MSIDRPTIDSYGPVLHPGTHVGLHEVWLEEDENDHRGRQLGTAAGAGVRPIQVILIARDHPPCGDGYRRITGAGHPRVVADPSKKQ